MVDQKLRHKKNMAFVSELPVALNSLKPKFFEFLSQGIRELSNFIFGSIQMLVCRRFGLDDKDEENIITPVDFNFERDEKEDYLLLTFEIDSGFVTESCDSKFFTIYVDLKTTDLRVFTLEYEPNKSLGEGYECYMLCENQVNGRHNNYGSLEDDTYQTYIEKIKDVLNSKKSAGFKEIDEVFG